MIIGMPRHGAGLECTTANAYSATSRERDRMALSGDPTRLPPCSASAPPHIRTTNASKGPGAMPTTKRPRQLSSATVAHLDQLLDEALQETFPASDPIAITAALDSIDR